MLCSWISLDTTSSKRWRSAPRVPNRSFWQTTYKVALDDLADLIAPANIVICEGNSAEADKGFDAACYNRLFSDTHPETLFVSAGGSRQVENSEELMTVLRAVAKGINVQRLIDRDDMTDDARRDKIRDGTRVLRRREIENYLYDPEVLSTFLQTNGKADLVDTILEHRRELLADRDSEYGDLKPIVRDLFRYIRTQTGISNLGNLRREFALQHLVPALKTTPGVYHDLIGDIFS